VIRYCVDCLLLRVRSSISKLETMAMWMSCIVPFALLAETSHLRLKLTTKFKTFEAKWKEGVCSYLYPPP
jgi:hypothetical protein